MTTEYFPFIVSKLNVYLENIVSLLILQSSQAGKTLRLAMLSRIPQLGSTSPLYAIHLTCLH